MGRKTISRHSGPQLRRGTEAKSNDPYLSRKGLKEPAQCTICRSVLHHKRWYVKEDPVVQKLQESSFRPTVCPACRKAREHYAEGVITLRGEFLSAHKEEILQLVRNEESRAKKENPLEGILSTKESGGTVEIQTTTERFAERIGKEIKRAYKGEITFHWTHGDKLVRVEWSRPSA
jgi:NMD protein affecting ribosome stability and mRNA decay